MFSYMEKQYVLYLFIYVIQIEKSDSEPDMIRYIVAKLIKTYCL